MYKEWGLALSLQAYNHPLLRQNCIAMLHVYPVVNRDKEITHMNTTKFALAAFLVATPVALFANDHADHDMATSEASTDLATPNMAVAPEDTAEAVSGTVVEGAGETMDAAEHDHGTMKKAVDDATNTAETLKKSAE